MSVDEQLKKLNLMPTGVYTIAPAGGAPAAVEAAAVEAAVGIIVSKNTSNMVLLIIE